MKNKNSNFGQSCDNRKKDGKRKAGRAAWIMALALLALLAVGCGAREPITERGGVQEAGAENDGASAAVAESDDNASSSVEKNDDVQESETGDETAGAPKTMADLLQESGNVPDKTEPPELPETVLWFNATYACLTYTNGWDWRWVGGQEPTEENARTTEYLLYSSWDVLDRKSGVETVNKLLGGGHRAKCRECMDNLEAWGLIDLNEERFAEEMTKIVTGVRTDIDLGDVPGRYVVAYYMYQMGIEAEYIAAWDLCRVNQLYADFYLCGFMDYEEAMDASLENSLRLQKMYDSWDEMMDAYMMGYQFWQGDLEITEDSPTKERRNYYEMLKNSDDNPYELDWNMELKKSW